jgi:energy-coupling factor transporter transmembrane protein EcfT
MYLILINNITKYFYFLFLFLYNILVVMRDIIIVLLAFLFTLLTIVLFDIKHISQQFLVLVFILLAFLIFYMAIDKLHIFKDSENEVNFDNTNFTEEGELLGNNNELNNIFNNEEELMEEDELRSEGQNLVEASNDAVYTQDDLINPNYSLENVNTNNFGNIENNFIGDLL